MIHQKLYSKFHNWYDRFHQKSVASMLENGVTVDEVLSTRFAISPLNHDYISSDYLAIEKKVSEALSRTATADCTLTQLLYFLIVVRKSRRVIETGVWHGVSSYFILSALKAVNQGRLISIDLPPLVARKRIEVGNVVPQCLRDRWSLRLGPSQELLGAAISEMEGVDIFIHDSDHSYSNMMMEFRVAWEGLPPGGLIVSDDAHTNDAVADFSRAVDRIPCVIRRHKGGAIALIEK